MKNGGISFASVTAIGLMTLYHFIPFLIVRGVPGPLGKLRPLLLAGSVLSIALGFYQSWKKRSRVPASKLSIVGLWVSSIVVFSMILFAQAIANVLANALGD